MAHISYKQTRIFEQQSVSTGPRRKNTVARASTKHINDTTTQEILTEAGALGFVSYQRKTQNVVLVPVNTSQFPTKGADLSSLAQRLNEIYGPAVVNWNVHIDSPLK